MSLFQPISIVSKKEAKAPIAKQFAAFETHKEVLLSTLQKGRKIDPHSKPFDAVKSWDEIARLASLYFWGRVMKQSSLSTRETIKRLQQLYNALRKAHGLTRRAIRDGIEDELFRAWFVQKNISLISAAGAATLDNEGSSLARVAEDIKELVEALATLTALSHTAAIIADVPQKGGRPDLLPKDCIQGLARVYRTSTGTKPGRGAGPFANFAAGFALAVGKTGFSRRSLIDAIQDAHLQFKPSWFDGKPPPF